MENFIRRGVGWGFVSMVLAIDEIDKIEKQQMYIIP
jgi:hypothetical protein